MPEQNNFDNFRLSRQKELNSLNTKQQPIRIIDMGFNLICEINDYESLSFTRNFSNYGRFELKMNRHKINAKYLQRGLLVYLSPTKVGIIDFRSPVVAGNPSQEVVTVRGYTLEFIFTYRITEVFSNKANWGLKDNVETVMKELIKFNLGSTVLNSKRRIALIDFKPDLKRGPIIDYSVRYKELNQELTDLSITHGIGINMTYDYKNKKFWLDTYEGRNLTDSQNVLPPVLFSTDFGNINSQRLTDSTEDYKSHAIVAGQGEGLDREIIQVYDGLEKLGLDRREIFVDARDIGPGSNTTLVERGRMRLSEHNPIYTVEGQIRPFNTFKFEKDYNLGDIVSIKFYDIGNTVSIDARITEINESWGGNNYEVDITFGNKIPNALSKINNKINNISTNS